MCCLRTNSEYKQVSFKYRLTHIHSIESAPLFVILKEARIAMIHRRNRKKNFGGFVRIKYIYLNAKKIR